MRLQICHRLSFLFPISCSFDKQTLALFFFLFELHFLEHSFCSTRRAYLYQYRKHLQRQEEPESETWRPYRFRREYRTFTSTAFTLRDIQGQGKDKPNSFLLRQLVS